MAKLEKLSQALYGLFWARSECCAGCDWRKFGSLSSDCNPYVKDLDFSVLHFLAFTCGKYLFLCSVCLLHSLFFSWFGLFFLQVLELLASPPSSFLSTGSRFLATSTWLLFANGSKFFPLAVIYIGTETAVQYDLNLSWFWHKLVPHYHLNFKEAMSWKFWNGCAAAEVSEKNDSQNLWHRINSN